MSEEGSKLKKEERQASILDTALDLMAEKGIESTTMRGIAKAEGISETLLYRFFSNKSELIYAIFEAKAVETANAIQELFETTAGMIPNPKETLPLICKLIKRRIEKNHRVFNILIKERVVLKQAFEEAGGFKSLLKDKARIQTYRKMMVDLSSNQSLTNYFQRCKDAGNLRADLEPKQCADLFLKLIWPTPVLGADLTKPFSPKALETSSDELFEASMKILLYGFMPDDKR